jgi:hypothetical protein
LFFDVVNAKMAHAQIGTDSICGIQATQDETRRRHDAPTVHRRHWKPLGLHSRIDGCAAFFAMTRIVET